MILEVTTVYQDPDYHAFRSMAKQLEQEGATVPDDEYARLAARDTAERLLDEAYSAVKGRPADRASFPFAQNEGEE